LKGNYDAVKWTNFFSLGNETAFSKTTTNYFRLRTSEWMGNIGINRTFGISDITLAASYSSVRVLRDPGKFITNNYLPEHPEKLRTNTFIGGSVAYSLSHLNDPVVPL